MDFRSPWFRPWRLLPMQLLLVSAAAASLGACNMATRPPAASNSIGTATAAWAEIKQSAPALTPVVLQTDTATVVASAVTTPAKPADSATTWPKVGAHTPGASLNVTQTVTASPTPDWTFLDPIQFHTPSPDLRVGSPFPLNLEYRLADPASLLRVDLYDAAGQLIFRQLIDLSRSDQKTGWFEQVVEYELRTSPQKGLLIARLESETFQPLAVNSLNLVLQGAGISDPVSYQPQEPYINIKAPTRQSEISTGELLVDGFTRAQPTKSLRVQLVAQDGGLLAQRLAKIQQQDAEGVYRFETSLNFRVSQRTEAWVLVFLNDGPGGEITHLASLPVVLLPKP